jgi:hypothetical protein
MTTRHLGPDFPLLDAPRPNGNNTFGRTILDTYGFVEAYVEETDTWLSMPLRLVHDQAAGWHLECGPYDFDRADIECLRQAIAGYDAATKPASPQ